MILLLSDHISIIIYGVIKFSRIYKLKKLVTKFKYIIEIILIIIELLAYFTITIIIKCLFCVFLFFFKKGNMVFSWKVI